MRVRLVAMLTVLAVLAGAGYWFVWRPSGAAEEQPVPGEVVTLEPIQVNLANGRYLKIGIALQLVEGAEEVEGAAALDATIELFSGQAVGYLTRRESRIRLQRRLETILVKRYQGDVIDVYYTDFVTQ